MADLFSQLKLALPDRYELERLLGSGGMATVYLARDRQQDRQVAIKLLRHELAGAVGQDRFLREIRIASQLTHPHILPLLDSGSVTLNGDRIPYYVMPYIEGESLRDRLVREKQLPVEDAIAIARDIAAALQYAHGHGIIHRDIKPENVLLTGREAVVADFGIARAIDRSADPHALTTRGVAIGTAAYMSPEQASAQVELDGRTDVYSLGCVVYEMLGGDPPFTGSSANAIAARHRVDTVPPLRTIRPSVPAALEAAVMRALEKIPADRFNTAEQFASALGHYRDPTAPIRAGVPRGPRRRRTWTLLAGVMVLTVGTGYAIFRDYRKREANRGVSLDTTRFAIISAQVDSTGSGRLNPALLLQDAMARWSGITLVDPIQVRDAVARRGVMKGDDWRRVARDVGAGRYIRVDATPVGDSIRVSAVLYDTREQVQLADRTIRTAADFAGSGVAYNDLAESLLFRGEGPHAPMDSLIGTSSAPARQAYARGHDALADWNLAAADSAFDAASRFDPQYAQALLWLALVRSWSGLPVTQWSSAAERAASGQARLSERERGIVSAVLAQAQNDARACASWGRLAGKDSFGFVVWYGWGDCLRRDIAVVRDPTSTTGWRFRSSYHQALKAYQRAFQLLPSMHRALSGESFAFVRDLLETSENQLREGRAIGPDTTSFLASASWEGDSLVFIPVPRWQVSQGHTTRTASTAEAKQRQRQLFRDIAAGWVSAFPQSADAMEALAISMEMLGDRSAIDTLRRAAQLAVEPGERLRVAAAEVWTLVRLSLPSDLDGLRTARRIADSLLRENSGPKPLEPRLLVSLAVLTGRANKAAQLTRVMVARGELEVPAAIAPSGPELMVYAAIGGPPDSIGVLESRVVAAINREISPEARASVRQEWLGLPATLAYPDYRMASIASLAGTGDYVLDGLAAFLRGDTISTRSALTESARHRQSLRASDITPDALHLEAWLIAALGDARAAGHWLDPTLDSIAGTDPQFFVDVFRAGPLVRVMALRADLAATVGDRATAKRWAAPVAVLWSDADEFLQPILRRMTALTR